jgi:hypothetical protein
LCHSGYRTIYIQPGKFREDIFTEICAHELTHNWQFEGNLNSTFQLFNPEKTDDKNNIWFEGKLFSEGQANFFAAKVMDFFGLRKMVYANEVQMYAQYREGLILMNYLEQKFGLTNLNEILKTAQFYDSVPVTLDDINKWYEESGIRDMVRGIADELIKHHMNCIHIEFLNKSSDFHRLTYFMNHQIDRRDKKLVDYLKDANISEEEGFKKIWEILKQHFNIKPTPGFDFLPCRECGYKDEESLDGLCMMFGSISVREKIKKELNFFK